MRIQRAADKRIKLEAINPFLSGIGLALFGLSPTVTRGDLAAPKGANFEDWLSSHLTRRNPREQLWDAITEFFLAMGDPRIGLKAFLSAGVEDPARAPHGSESGDR